MKNYLVKGVHVFTSTAQIGVSDGQTRHKSEDN